MILTHGGLVGGYGLYIKEGKPVFVYNYLSIDRYFISGTKVLPAGKVNLKVDIDYQGKPGEFGKAAKVTLYVNGAKSSEGQLPKTIPASISISEGLDVGMDAGSPVDFTYKLPFRFTGKIEKVIIELK